MSTPMLAPGVPDMRRRVAQAAHTASDLPALQAAVAHWLLHRGAQVAAGEHAGGVAGWLDGKGQPDYVYPEITGYFLHWLAWRALQDERGDALATRAAAAQAWVRAWLATGETPATRVYTRPGVEDWRNGASFLFDHAMLLRGLGCAVQQGLLAPDRQVVDGLCAQLHRLLAADGMFKACSATHRGVALPDRWSTRRGGFLAKAASGILVAARTLTIAPVLVDAAAATFRASVRWAVATPHVESHPFLYCVEGILSLPEHAAFRDSVTVLRPQLRAFFRAVEASGRVAETCAGVGAERVDVVAQALRVGIALHMHGYDDVASTSVLTRLAALLAAAVRADGAVPFDALRVPQEFNVWTAIFAEQALAAAAQFERGRGFSPRPDLFPV
jgi:hypothetical protein